MIASTLLKLFISLAPVLLIQSGGIGDVSLGDSPTVVMSMYPKSKLTTEEQEGYPTEIIEVKDSNATLLFVAEIDDGKVWRLSVRNPKFKTKEGIGATASLQAVIKTYGKPEIIEGEGAACATFASRRGMSFCLDKSRKVVESVIVHNVKN